jgi:hypothetical protein
MLRTHARIEFSIARLRNFNATHLLARTVRPNVPTAPFRGLTARNECVPVAYATGAKLCRPARGFWMARLEVLQTRRVQGFGLKSTAGQASIGARWGCMKMNKLLGMGVGVIRLATGCDHC